MTSQPPNGMDELVEDVLGAACWGTAPGSLVDLAHRRSDVLNRALRRVKNLSPGRLGGRPRGVVRHDLLYALATLSRRTSGSGGRAPRPSEARDSR